MRKLYLIVLLCFTSLFIHAQEPLLVEHFDYPAGDQIRDYGWTPHSAGSTNPLLVTDGGLSWSQTAYLGSGVGNACAIDYTGSDENKPFSSWVTEGSVYASFLMSVPEPVTSENAGFFFHFGEYSNIDDPDFSSISTAFRARTFKAPGSSADTYRLGLNFNAAAVPTDPDNLTAELNINETYLVVVKYEVVEGPGNDLVSLYVFADGDDIENEPATADIGPIGGTAGDLSAVQLVALRQYTPEQHVIVDGIVVRESWDLLQEPGPPFTGPELLAPADGALLEVMGSFQQEVEISWTEALNAPGEVSYEWQLASREAGNFDAPLAALASGSGGSATSLSLNFGALEDLLTSLGVNEGETVEGIWRVVASSGGETVFSVDTFDIDIFLGEVLSVSDHVLSGEMSLYPNPATGFVNVQLGDVPSGLMEFRIVNLLGQSIRSNTMAVQSNQQVGLKLEGIPSGVYMIVMQNGDASGVKKLVVR